MAILVNGVLVLLAGGGRRGIAVGARSSRTWSRDCCWH